MESMKAKMVMSLVKEMNDELDALLSENHKLRRDLMDSELMERDSMSEQNIIVMSDESFSKEVSNKLIEDNNRLTEELSNLKNKYDKLYKSYNKACEMQLLVKDLVLNSSKMSSQCYAENCERLAKMIK